MNIISKKVTSFYPFFLFSLNNRKTIDKTEKETFVIFMVSYLKLENNNTSFLLKVINQFTSLLTAIPFFKLIQKNKNMNLLMVFWMLITVDDFFGELKQVCH